jgi:pilus assembly protein CpaC
MRARVAFAFFFIIIVFVARPEAQGPAPMRFSPAPAANAAPAPTMIDLFVGRSTVLNVGATIHRVSLTIPEIADALVTGPQQILLHGKAPGTISLFVWDKAGGIKTFEVNVRRDLDILKEQVAQLFPGEPIAVAGTGKDVVVSGTVSSKYVVDKAAALAGGFVEKPENVVNLLRVQEGVASNQVMLRVRFAEVSRSALQELGASFVADAYKGEWFGRTGTQQFAAPEWDEQGRLVFSDFLNLFVFNAKEGIGGIVRALQNKGLFQSLAEPNLVAVNGKEASFLAGGEYPYPVVQGSAAGQAVTIMFKEFGIRLRFTPTVLGGDLINLKVEPEVSALDFSNAVTIEGFRVPALSTRRTNTEVELRDGQTFAIAGLLNNTVTSSMSKIPGIGDIPILGLLFKSRALQKNQTELVVMITPYILRRDSTGVSGGLPNNPETFLEAPAKQNPPPPPYVGSPRFPIQGQPAARPGGSPAPAPAPAKPAAAKPGTTTTSQPSSTAPARPGASPAPPKPSGGGAARAPATNSGTTSRTTTPAAAKPNAAAPAPTAQQIKEDRERYEAMQRAIAEAEKRDAEESKEDAKKAEEERKKAEKAAKKKEEEDRKRAKALAEAAERLRAAQAAYQAEIEKAGKAPAKPKGGGEGGSR